MTTPTTTTEPDYGTRSACTRCGLDVEYIGDGEWHDRGGNTGCTARGGMLNYASLPHVPHPDDIGPSPVVHLDHGAGPACGVTVTDGTMPSGDTTTADYGPVTCPGCTARLSSGDAYPGTLWCVSANVETTTPDGWGSSRQVPTFYLHPNVQGTLTREDAERVAAAMLADLVDDPAAVFHVTATLATVTG
jgi:hypothetical protein